MRIAVNHSARQFVQANLTALVAQVLEEFDLPADALELEITESLMMHPSEDNMAILNQLSGMGRRYRHHAHIAADELRRLAAGHRQSYCRANR